MEILAMKHKEKKRKKVGCKFIRTNADEKNFHEWKFINEIYIHIEKSTKKTLIDKIPKKILGIEFESNHSIKLNKSKKKKIKKIKSTKSNKVFKFYCQRILLSI